MNSSLKGSGRERSRSFERRLPFDLSGLFIVGTVSLTLSEKEEFGE